MLWRAPTHILEPPYQPTTQAGFYSPTSQPQASHASHEHARTRRRLASASPGMHSVSSRGTCTASRAVSSSSSSGSSVAPRRRQPGGVTWRASQRALWSSVWQQQQLGASTCWQVNAPSRAATPARCHTAAAAAAAAAEPEGPSGSDGAAPAVEQRDDGSGDGVQDHDSSSSSTPDEQQEQQQPYQWRFSYHSRVAPEVEPVPVQLPPPGASPAPSPLQPYFNRAYYKPARFLQHFPAPAGSAYNYLSFLGSLDPGGGKYRVAGHQLDEFLTSYHTTLALTGKRVYLAESYQDQPFKFFQELDFPWSLSGELVLALIPRVAAIVADEVARQYTSQLQPGEVPQPLLSMRTVFKVHLNFPGVYTVEAGAMAVRKAVINRCRAELSGQQPLQQTKLELVLQEHLDAAQAALRELQQAVQQLQAAGGAELPHVRELLGQLRPQVVGCEGGQQPQQQQQQQQPPPVLHVADASGLPAEQQQLDWESIIDFPHGSLRLLGSCKAPWMDSDPEWVAEKCYSPVQCVDGVWLRQPLTPQAVQESSILLRENELRVFETSDEFLEGVYQTVGQREQVLAAKRLLRSANKATATILKQLQSPQQQRQNPQQQQQQAAAGGDGSSPREQSRTAARRINKQRQEQEARKAEAERQQRQQEALAKLQAIQATSAAQKRATAPAVVRPNRPAWPKPPSLPPAPREQQ